MLAVCGNLKPCILCIPVVVGYYSTPPCYYTCLLAPAMHKAYCCIRGSALSLMIGETMCHHTHHLRIYRDTILSPIFSQVFYHKLIHYPIPAKTTSFTRPPPLQDHLVYKTTSITRPPPL